MDVDRALVDFRRRAPDEIEQLRAREDAAGLLEQEFEQPELGGPEMNVAARAAHTARLAVEVDVARLQAIGDALGPGAPQQRAHARHQLRHRERLHDIIVGADGQAAHALGFLAARGQHDDRQVARLVARAQSAADFEAGDAGQHPVEDDEIGRRFGDQRLRFVAAFGALDDIAFRLEIIGQQQRQRLLVLHHQHARGAARWRLAHIG